MMVFMYEYIVWAFGENETIKKDIEFTKTNDRCLFKRARYGAKEENN